MNTKDLPEITFKEIGTDTTGNNRYVCHFLRFIVKSDEFVPQAEKYALALKRARSIGGKKYHNQKYGGGIVFTADSLSALKFKVLQLVAQLEKPIEFLQEWTQADFKKIEKRIRLFLGAKHFKSSGEWLKLPATFQNLVDILGLWYTSTGAFAMYSICNLPLQYDDNFEIKRFGITQNGKTYAELEDANGNERLIEI